MNWKYEYIGSKLPCPLTSFGKPERDVPQELMVTEELDSIGEAAKEEVAEKRVSTSTDGPTR